MDRRLVALLVPLVAGCLSAPEPPLTEPVPFALTLTLQPDGSMAEGALDATQVPLAWGWRQWLDGVEPPAWRTTPLDAPMLVTKAQASVHYVAQAPVTTLGTRPELTVWFGAGIGVSDHGFQDGPPALAPGAGHVATFDLALPAGGLYVAAGEPLVLRIGSYYNDDAQRSAVAVALGGETPTTLTLEGTRLPAATLPRVSAASESRVELTGGRCMGLDPATENDLAWLDVSADPSQGRLIGIDIDVAHAGGEGTSDIDFVLLDAEGEVVGRSQGSAGVERLSLREPNLAAAPSDGSWQLGVYACTPQRSSADVVVTLHYA